ncbi:WAS/WASL-interacting protein family member 1-like isoform X2 [Nilaparvata lugens]|uniref:WAS/WASL-interacting protein family member 1-like isoform X2 n=1 Tax=Nilaparvata lugens TaxID=108931 RepID=UPI00193DBA44|nr:WAS/WASL-interacting protein family member 1-like isoform X2 [Nilaparvata lugens]
MISDHGGLELLIVQKIWFQTLFCECSKAEVTGSYTYVDDVGERHNVQYEAGPRTGFHVKTLYPDSTPYTGLFYRGAPANKQTGPLRGKTSIQRGTDGSYRFTATGPDQRRTEVSDAANNVRGSYTYLDDKGVQRTVQYIAGPNIGYKVIGGNKGLSPAGSSPGGSTGQFPYSPPDIETASPTSSAPPQKDSLNPSANLDEELFGPAPPGPLPSGEPEKQQQEIQGDPEDFLNTPLYGASGSASPQYSEPSSTLAPTLSPTPSPSPIPVSQLPQDFDDFLPPLSAFPEDDPSIPKPRPQGGGGGSPSYLTLEDNDFLKTPFALLPVGDSYDNSNYGGQFKRPKSNNNPNVNNNNNDNNQPTPNRNVPVNSRDRVQTTNIGNTRNNDNNNNNNNIYRTPPSAPGRDRPGYNNNNDNTNNNYIPSTGRERESYSPPSPPPMRDRDNPPPQPFSPPPGNGGDNFFNTAPGRDGGFTIPPPSTPKDGFPLLNFGGEDDDFLPPLPGANDFPVPPAGGRIDYPPPTPPKERPNYFEGGRDRDREPSRRPYLHRDHKYSPSQKTFLGIPSGVAVRAHVQSLDILPFGSRIPPPGQALDYERRRLRTRRR